LPPKRSFSATARPVVYKLDGSMFVERRSPFAKRGKEQAIVDRGVAPGDRIATRRPSRDDQEVE
jgi:hypothetical protein